MKKIIVGICILFFLSNYAWADDTKNVIAETLAKSSSSWDGVALWSIQKVSRKLPF